MTFAQYYKTVDEFTQPLSCPTSPVYRAGLRLEQCETRVVPCPFAAEFRPHGDAGRFAREYIPTLRSWTESTFFAALSPNRALEERQAIVDRYYDAYEALVRDRVKFRVGRIVYLAFSRDEELMGFGFPKELREALIDSAPEKFLMPPRADLRYNWVVVRLSSIDDVEMRQLVVVGQFEASRF